MPDEKLPDKVIQIDMLRLKKDYKKNCNCIYPHFDVDVDNFMVTCRDCGAIIDPYDAIKRLAFHHERLNGQIQSQLAQRREIDNYKPQLVVIKYLEQQYRGPNVMLPQCPHCHEVFDLKDLVNGGWTSKAFNDKIRGKGI